MSGWLLSTAMAASASFALGSALAPTADESASAAAAAVTRIRMSIPPSWWPFNRPRRGERSSRRRSLRRGGVAVALQLGGGEGRASLVDGFADVVGAAAVALAGPRP